MKVASDPRWTGRDMVVSVKANHGKGGGFSIESWMAERNIAVPACARAHATMHMDCEAGTLRVHGVRMPSWFALSSFVKHVRRKAPWRVVVAQENAPRSLMRDIVGVCVYEKGKLVHDEFHLV